nr:radical SAM protein [Oscillospiraceae bacterium]
MCITYIVEGNLYVNITNKCSNRCDFCIRNNGDGAYGSDSLWLEREPTREEILESIFSRDLSIYSELVFCGYGEPTYRLDDAVYVARAVKQRYPEIKIRINTNGHSDLINGRDTAPDFEGAFDVVSISLNSPSAQKYDEICHSKFGEKSHSALIRFAENVKNYVQNTKFSVVKQTLTPEEIKQCMDISKRVGVTLRVRDYIPPET